MSYRRRQAVIAALTANALRPVPGYYAGIPAMFGGWLTSELAPHVLALSAADTLREITRGGRDRHALALAGLGAVGLTALMVQSEGAKSHVDAALCEALGDDYLDHLQRTHTDLDLSTPLRQLAMPFRMRDDEVEVLKDGAFFDSLLADVTTAQESIHYESYVWWKGQICGELARALAADPGWTCGRCAIRRSSRTRPGRTVPPRSPPRAPGSPLPRRMRRSLSTFHRRKRARCTLCFLPWLP